MTIELPRIITSFTDSFRSKWADLPTLVAQPVLVERNEELEFHVRVDELEAQYQTLIDTVTDELSTWFWPHELNTAGNHIVALIDFLETPFTMDAPVWPDDQPTFQQLWDAA